MRSFHPMPALLIELPVLVRKEIEQQAIVRQAVDGVTLPLPADETEVEALQASNRRVAVDDPRIDYVKPEVAEREGQKLRAGEAHVSSIGERLLPRHRP